MRDGLEVLGIHTGPIPARVVEFEFIWNLTKSFLVVGAMRADHSTVASHEAWIATVGDMALPDPAATRVIDEMRWRENPLMMKRQESEPLAAASPLPRVGLSSARGFSAASALT